MCQVGTFADSAMKEVCLFRKGMVRAKFEIADCEEISSSKSRFPTCVGLY